MAALQDVPELGPTKEGRAVTAKTNAKRSAAAKKAAATRKRNEAKSSGADLKKAVGNAVDVAKDLGGAVVGAASSTAKSVSRRAGS